MTEAVATLEELLGRANEALGNADWERARSLFSAALEQQAAPEALEGLGNAAFFLSEADLALDTRERAYAAYRDAGRPVDAARVAIALAWDCRVRGERAVADGWLAQARRLLDGCGP